MVYHFNKWSDPVQSRAVLRPLEALETSTGVNQREVGNPARPDQKYRQYQPGKGLHCIPIETDSLEYKSYMHPSDLQALNVVNMKKLATRSTSWVERLAFKFGERYAV